ncbi:MAG: tRNA lysidine(34) synthetase TilS, partial [Planctomycetes bacterium]|nr:tRNA lysidine(34) synthetase TilS [Planctomycetota bacterium]
MLIIQKKVSDMIKNFSLFKKHEAILIAISGGPDSVALLNLLIQVNQIKNIYSKLYLAHLNHLLRGEESERDEHFVREIAKNLNIPIIVEQRDIRKCARISKLSLEEAAREERYDFLGAAARHFDTQIIVTGHTADDDAETILHRIIRGTGIIGLGGMRPKRRLFPSSEVVLVRPLLSIWKTDIITYLKQVNIPYRTDLTNLGTDTFRSRCRVELIPLLEKNYNVKVKQSLKKLGEISTRNYDYLESEADLLFERILLHKTVDSNREIGSVTFDITPLRKVPEILQQIIIKKALTEMGVPLKKFGHKQYECLLDMLKQKCKSTRRRINNYITVVTETNTLHLIKENSHEELKPVQEELKLLVPGETILKELGYTIKTEIREIASGTLEKFELGRKKYEEIVDLESIRMPLTVRTKREGDRFVPLGSNGSKKLKDFFIDSK